AQPTPTITAVSTVQGTRGNSNDGASTVALQAADLVTAVTTPPPAHRSSPVGWTVTVRNSGPGPSSGSTFRFPVPAGVTALQAPNGCSLSAGTVTCVAGALADGASDDFVFTAVSPPSGAVAVSAPITVQGNEEDPTAATSFLVVTPDQVLTSDGTGTDRQSVSTGAPAAGSVTLLDGDTPVDTLAVPGGRYAVDGRALTFTPAYGWSGTATAARFRVTDASGATGVGSYTVTVRPPAPPTPPSLSSGGAGTATQQVALPVPPAGGAVAVLDGHGDPVTSLVVDGQGRYTADLATRTVSFSPVLGFTGKGSIAYRLTDAYGQSASSTYEPTVTVPAGPAAPALTSAGVGTAPQSVTLPTAPAGGSRTLLGDDGAATTGVVHPGEGAYAYDASSGTATFTPVLGFEGSATPARYRLTDAYGQSVSGTYAPTVGRPSGPSSESLLTSSGVGTAPQQATVPAAPAGGSRTLLGDDGAATTGVVRPGEGAYTYDASSGTVTFTPVLGFAGPSSVGYRLTDAYGQAVDGSYQPTVIRPDPPTPGPATTTGIGTATQQTSLPAVPDGGSLVVLDGGGHPVTDLTVPGQGSYRWDTATGMAAFDPVLGFQGTATPLTYRVTDAYGQWATATWTTTVLPPAPPVADPRDSSGVGTAPHQVTVPAAPAGGSRTLLGDDGAATTGVVRPGEGAYAYDESSGTVTFTPVLGFAGTSSVGYRLTDAYGQTSRALWSATVISPAPPVAEPRDSTGLGTASQSVTLPGVPEAGGRRLVGDDGAATTGVVRPGEGAYTYDASSGTVTFTPVLGFAGTSSVGYRLTDAYGQTSQALWSATVIPPVPPIADPRRSTGTGLAAQSPLSPVPVPPGGSIALLAGSDPVTVVTLPGEGTATVTPEGVLTFTPVLGHVGTSLIGYRLTDAYGQTSGGVWSATVTPPTPPT
ncbi:Ig-like domain-containing protein, partial [Modestobacter altitudinis]|uniref:Ig-like domain-containing protein n=1 Tax=Modestobacter altitudinis TaxID=2213158 RepID=UPI00110CE5C8